MFDHHLFVINQFDGLTQSSMMNFDKAKLLVQFHNLLLRGMNRECGEKMGRSMWVVEDVVVKGDDVGCGNFMRVRFLLDLRKLLTRERTITLHGLKYWISL